MYDRQILVDYFNGQRTLDDPKVQREFLLLKRQAELDWEKMYAGKDRPETPETIAEDYVYNAKLTAKTERRLSLLTLSLLPDEEEDAAAMAAAFRWLAEQPKYRPWSTVLLGSLAGPVIISAIGPVYYGFTGGPYWLVVVWALASAILFLLWAIPSFKYSLITAPSSVVGKALVVIAITVFIAATVVAGDSLVYLLVRTIH
jgi:hypothetical protein